MYGVIDAEVVQKDDINFAQPVLGQLPIYCFPSNPNDLSSDPVPAISINGAWFRVNRIAGVPKSDDSELRTEVERLLTDISDLQYQMDSKDLEITELREKLRLNTPRPALGQDEVSILKSEVETLKRRLTQAQSRKNSEVNVSHHQIEHRTAQRPSSPAPKIITTNPSGSNLPPELTYSESVVDVSTVIKV